MDKKSAVTVFLLLLLAPCLTPALPAKAQACSLIVPDQYPTISAALANAQSGDIIFVRSGVYNENMLQINSSISLIGEGPDTTVINCLQSGYLGNWPHMYSPAPIRINTDNVVVSGFTLQGGMASIYGGGDGIQVIGNVMDMALELTGSNQIVANNTVGTSDPHSLGDIESNGNNNVIADNKLIFDSTLGIDVKGLDNMVYGNTVSGDAWPGIQLEYNTTGTVIARNALTNCSISWDNYDSQNTVCGNYVGGAISLMGFNNVFYGNTITYVVGIGGTHGGTEDAANNLFYENNFLVNSTPVMIFTNNPGPESWDNGRVGNYWNNYNGTDSNGDGIGDQPYLVTSTYSDTGYPSGNLGTDNYPLMAPFNISSVNVIAPEWVDPVFNPPAYISNPSPSPQSTPCAVPSISPSSLPTPEASQEPTPAIGSKQSVFSQTTLSIIAFIVVVGLIIGILLIFRKPKYN